MDAGAVLCGHHGNRNFEKYCMDHDVPCCALCVQETHCNCQHVLSLGQKATGAYRTKLSTEEMDTQTGSCGNHGNQKLEKYCEDHDAVCCGTCIQERHGNCRKLVSLGQKAAGVLGKQELRDILKKIGVSMETVTALAKAQKTDMARLTQEKARCRSAIKQTRQEIEDLFDKLESDLQCNLNQKHTKLRDLFVRNEEECEKMESSLSVLQTELNTVMKTKDEVQTFTVMKRAESECSVVDTILADIRKSSSGSQLEFKINETLNSFLENLDCLGTIGNNGNGHTEKIKTYVKPVSRASVAKKQLINRAEPMASFSIRFTGDEKDCDIIGSTVLPNGNLLFTDIGNNKVKHVDTSFRQIADLKLSSFPYEITSANSPQGNGVFVTVPTERTVQEIRIKFENEGKLALGRAFATEGDCRSLSWCKAGLAVSVETSEGDQIHVMDPDKGTVLRRIFKDPQGKAMFRCPYNSVALADGGTLLVSDRATDVHSVVGLDVTTGACLFRYTDAKLKWPRGMTKDDRGSVYVVGGESHNVHQVSEQGEKIRCLLSSKDGLKWPRSISCLQDGRLVVANKWSNDVRVFKLS